MFEQPVSPSFHLTLLNENTAVVLRFKVGSRFESTRIAVFGRAPSALTFEGAEAFHAGPLIALLPPWTARIGSEKLYPESTASIMNWM
jgi:hypothetical protein